MKKLVLLLLLLFVIAGCKEKKSVLNPEDFEIRSASWDSEIEFDCGKCDKPVCMWEMAWELEYMFNPGNGEDEALCWYYVDNKVEIKPIFQRNKMKIGVGRISDPDLLVDCWEGHKVGLCCAYTVDELLDDNYVCKDVLLEALCP